MDFSQKINEMFKELKSFFQSETVVGSPIYIGNIVLVPIISVSFGAGGGGGNGNNTMGINSEGGGAGVGGKITPHTILVIKDDDVTAIPLAKGDPLDKIFEMVPDVLSKINVTEENIESD